MLKQILLVVFFSFSILFVTFLAYLLFDFGFSANFDFELSQKIALAIGTLTPTLIIIGLSTWGIHTAAMKVVVKNGSSLKSKSNRDRLFGWAETINTVCAFGMIPVLLYAQSVGPFFTLFVALVYIVTVLVGGSILLSLLSHLPKFKTPPS